MKIRLLLLFFLMNTLSTFAQYQIGQKYHIFQYRANVRDEPSRNSKVLAILSLHDKVEILENSQIHEKINDVWGYWYKIKYGNIIGYTFGGNLAFQTLITDIDKNGINDYFSYRLSYSYNDTDFGTVYNLSDIKIYINNEKISTEKLNNYWKREIDLKKPPIHENDINRAYNINIPFSSCRIKGYNGHVIIELLSDQRCWINIYRFKIFPDGNSRIIAYIFDNDDDPENVFFEYSPNGICRIIAQNWTENGWSWNQ
jgi:hypothetical protein